MARADIRYRHQYRAMIAGNIGSDLVMSHTVIGDARTWLRLESLNKQYGRESSSANSRRAPEEEVRVEAAWRRDRRRARRAVAIFELIGRDGEKPVALRSPLMTKETLQWPRSLMSRRGHTHEALSFSLCSGNSAPASSWAALAAMKKAQQAQDVSEEGGRPDVLGGGRDAAGVGRQPEDQAAIRRRQDQPCKYTSPSPVFAIAQQTERAKPADLHRARHRRRERVCLPGGFVHTRGALADQNESEPPPFSATIGHVVRKHTINAIKKNAAVKMGTQAAPSRAALSAGGECGATAFSRTVDRANSTPTVLCGYHAKDRLRASIAGRLSGKARERNKNQAERNGLFASPPKHRAHQEGPRSAKAFKPRRPSSLATRRTSASPTALTSIAVVTDGSARIVNGEERKERGTEEGVRWAT